VSYWGKTGCEDYRAQKEVKAMAVNSNLTRLVLEIIDH
jgi:hypothetical protein